MKHFCKVLSLLLITALVCSLLPTISFAAGYNLGDGGYTKIGSIPNTYVAAQGMTADENYVYSLKTPSGDHNNAIIYRTAINGGSTIALANADNTSTTVLNGLGHGNDMAAVVHNGKTYLYVLTMFHVGHPSFSAHTIWKLEVNGNTVRKVAYYDITSGSDPINFVNMTLHSFENGTVKLLASINTMVFSIDIGINQGSSTIPCKYICPLNYNSITVPTGAPGYSGTGYYGVQGMTYNNGYLYFVMTAGENNTYRNKNFIIAYDLSNLADGSLRNNVQAQTIYLTSSYYWYFLEIESLCAVNGRMYFTANAGSSGGYYNNEDFVGCFNHFYDTDPNGILLEFNSGSRETTWNWRHYIGSSGASISPNPTVGNGYLSGTLGVLTSEGQTSTDSFVRMTARDVLYKIKAGDIVEIAFDYKRLSGTAPNSAAVFFTSDKVGYFTADRMFAGSSHDFRDGRNVLRFALSQSSAAAVGEYIGQLRIDLFDGGSADFKANYAIDYIYIGQPQNSPQSKLDYRGNGAYLFMDFVASSPLNTGNVWGGNNLTAAIDHSAGVLKGNIIGGDPYIQTYQNLNQKIKSGDIIEIRMKTSLTAGKGGHAEVFFATDKQPGYNGTNYFAVPVYPNGEYTVAYMELPASVVGHTMTDIRVDPVSSGANDSLQGSYTIDYIYIGTPNRSPGNLQTYTGGNRYLLVDFSKKSPLCETSDWITHSSTVTANHSEGVLKGTYSGGDPYVQSVGDILYDAQKGDIVEIRIKSNITSGNCGGLEFFYTTRADGNYDGNKYLITSTVPGSTYQIIRMPLPDHIDRQLVNSIRFDPVSCGENEGLKGTFEVDYIYLGPKDQAPGSLYTVTFCDENGKVLEEQTLSEGETAVYSKALPTKAPDDSKHYTFAGWVDSNGKAANLENIKADLKVYASFTAEYHHFTITTEKEPTCSAEGTERYTCACGKTYTESIPTTDHKTTVTNAVAPTCTDTGYSGDKVCTLCGVTTEKGSVLPVIPHTPVIDKGYASTCTELGLSDGSHCGSCGVILEQQTLLPLADHSPETVPGKEPTCLSSGLTEGKICSVCHTVLVVQTAIPRLGHSYTYTDLGDSHKGTCTRCQKTTTASHSYANGTCVCGAKEQADPTVDSSITINHTLDLASDISVNFAVKASLLEDYVNHHLEVEIPVYTDNALTGSKTVTIEPTLNKGYYYYTLTGLTAIQMNDVVTARLYMEKDGQTFVSLPDTYSIAQCAYAQLDKTAASQKLKALCAELLRYGKEAQLFKSYRTDALADSKMTDTHRAYLSDAEAVTFGNTDEILSDLTAPQITWAGKALNLESKVAVKYIFNLNSYSGNVENLILKVRYVNRLGESAEVILTDPQVYDLSKGRYAFSFDGLLAAELRSTIEVAIYEGETRLSQTLRYSPDTYGNGKNGQLLTLCKALFAYSDVAKAFFS